MRKPTLDCGGYSASQDRNFVLPSKTCRATSPRLRRRSIVSSNFSMRILSDNRLICFAFADAYQLGVLSSRIHVLWTLANGGTLEDRPIYTKVRCFDPFPFPDASEALIVRLGLAAVEMSLLAEQSDQPATAFVGVVLIVGDDVAYAGLLVVGVGATQRCHVDVFTGDAADDVGSGDEHPAFRRHDDDVGQR